VRLEKLLELEKHVTLVLEQVDCCRLRVVVDERNKILVSTIFPCPSHRRSDAVLDNEKVFLMDNGKCIYFSLSVPQKKFGLTQPLSADSMRVLLATNNIVREQEKRKMPGTNPPTGNFIFFRQWHCSFFRRHASLQGTRVVPRTGKILVG